MTPEELHLLARAWRRHLLGRDVLIIAAVMLGVAAIALVWIDPRVVWPLALGFFIAASAARMLVAPARKLDAVQVAHHLDRAFPQLEESSALFLQRPDTLTAIQRLQRARAERAAQAMRQAGSGIHFAAPRGLLRVPVWSVSAALVLLLTIATWRFIEQQKSRPPADDIVAPDATSTSPSPTQPQPTPAITRAEMQITPPAYTGRGARTVSGLTTELEEGATVTWSLTFDQAVTQSRLVFGTHETLSLEVDRDELTALRVISETTLYHAAGALRDGTEWKSADLHSLKVVTDQPAVLRILQPNLARTVIDPPGSQVMVEVLSSDDYGITAAHLIATVAKGTGEAVKFREQQIAFDRNEAAPDAPNGRRFTKVLDLAALGLEPGDELYFHVEARDNREPVSHSSRSETRFIVLRGPEQRESTPGTGVAALNVLPEYFRSQRQIIIDTEKLIAERTQLTEQEFTRRSNDLGIDQQLLRQRYGQFLGQEEHFESDGHDHSSMPISEVRTQEQVVEQFGHKHDSEDEATFFQGEAKATMRDALAAMWEAEGLLRTARPGDVLAPENGALEILKTLQQADREYVKRVGFEATPLNVAERRLRGDVSAVPARATVEVGVPQRDEQMRAIREALRDGENVRATAELDAALTTAATDDPQRFLRALQILRRRAANEALSDDDAAELQRAFLQMLPKAQPLPQRADEVSPSLAQRFFERLEDAL